MQLRAALRTSIEAAATLTGLTAAARLLASHRVAILAYHNVIEPSATGRGDASLHLPLPAFLRQVERLARTHDVVPLDEAVRPRRSGRPRAVLTFDDAYRGAVTLALPQLARRGLPATVFVAPGLLGAASTWWDELGAAGRLSDTRRDEALHAHGGRTGAVRAALLRNTAVPRLPDTFGIATAAELHEHCRNGVTLGSHSWSHEHLPSLTERELRDNLSRTLAWLHASGLLWSPWLSLPYGAGSDLVERVALEVGHAGVLRVDGGLAGTGGPTRLPRVNVPAGLSVRGLELRASGLVWR